MPTRTLSAGASRGTPFLAPTPWLHDEAEVVDTTHLTPAQAALQIAEAVKSWIW